MNVTIIGAGIAGLAAAIALKQAGIPATIYESAPEITPVGAGLGLAPNALSALKAIGIEEEVMAAGQILPWFNILNRKGEIITSTDNNTLRARYGHPTISIHRSALHSVLLQALDANRIFTGKKAINITSAGRMNTIYFADGTTVESEHIIIADGIHSVLRNYVAPQSTLRYAGYTCWRGLVTNTSAAIAGASEIWGPEGRFGMVPLPDNDIYWFACINAKPNDASFRSFTITDLKYRFRNYHVPVQEVLSMPLKGALIQHDIYDLQPLHRFAYGKVLLMGDAAHATTPNMAQGACQGLEDAATLLYSINSTSSLADAFKSFEKKRWKKTKAVIDQSRRIGAVAQLENPFLIALRNAAMRYLPASLQQKQFDKIYRTEF